METRELNLKEILILGVAWLGSVAAAIVDLAIVREVVLDIMNWIGYRQALQNRARGVPMRGGFNWTIQTVDLTTFLVLACIGAALAVVLDRYYRDGLVKGQFARRLARVAMLLACVAVVGLALRALV